jgi:hypothetical protein
VSFAGAGRIATAVLLVVVCRTPSVYGEDSPRTAEADRVSVDVARDRAQLLHRVYAATLDAMHEHYFQANRSVLPARAMEDVFSELADQAEIEARWISVNTPPMSVSHEPSTPFEKEAAQAIAAGKPFFEQIEQGPIYGLRRSPCPAAA